MRSIVNPSTSRSFAFHLRRSDAAQWQRGATSLELLICVAIIGVLVALLFPVVGRLRQSSRDMICQARLSKLALAAMAYRTEHRSFPRSMSTPATPSPAMMLPVLSPLLAGLLEPQKVESTILNQLAHQLGYSRILDTTPAIDLPSEVQSPDVEWIDTGRGPITLSSGRTTYYTGFLYAPGLAASGPSTVSPAMYRVLKPQRIPEIRGVTGVLWADDVHGSNIGSPGEAWQFTHPRGGAAAGPQPLTYLRPADCRGQHRAYADGSTDWARGDELGVDGSAPDKSATYFSAGAYWWF
jgi:type II secretory pathway pseudopilin PulG